MLANQLASITNLLPNNTTYTYSQEECENVGLGRWINRTRRNSDVQNIIGIIVKSPRDRDSILNSFNEIKLIIGANIIINIDGLFLKQIATFQSFNNGLIINIPFEIFIKKIPSIALMYHDIQFQINLEHYYAIESLSLVIENQYLDGDERNSTIDTVQNIPVQSLQRQREIFESNNVRIRLNFDGHCKGLFIFGDIDNITNVKLDLNHQTFYNYSSEMLLMIGKRISPNMLYIPFNNNVNWNTNDESSYIGSINFSRIDNSLLSIQFSTSVRRDITIYTLAKNTFRINSGVGVLTNPISSIVSPVTVTGTGTTRSTSISSSVITSLTSSTVRETESWRHLTKRINPEKSYCSIKLESIGEDEEYCECNKCHNCFNADALKTMFSQLNKKCPMCRDIWSDFSIYKNS